MRILKEERGLKFKNGEIVKVLKNGMHTIFPWKKVDVYSVNKKFMPEKSLEMLIQNKLLADELEIVEIKDGEIALHLENGVFKEILTEGKHAFWKSYHQHEFKKINLADYESAENIEPAIAAKLVLKPYIFEVEIENGKKGILFVDGKIVKILEQGKYRFWRGIKAISVSKVDLRQQQMEIQGQEILTKDKVGIRVNLFCQYKIIDIEKAALEISNYEIQFYVLMQLVLREYISNLTLDEILIRKEEIGIFILENMKEKAQAFGIEIVFAGIKDVILPGEIKDIMNQVLIAEKKAQANIIMRREETASTRSLLNTAKLMEENEILFRLKELEYIERISEKINQVSISGGGQMLEQLRQLFIPEASKK